MADKPVHPGSFCHTGATGTSTAGTPMVCSAKNPGERARWRRDPTAPATPRRKRAAKAAKMPHVNAVPVAPLPQPVEDRIRKAYDNAASTKNRYVWIADLRDALPDVSRDEFDNALREMSRGDAWVVPESNQKTLTDRDRAGALQMGNQDKHLVTFPGRTAEPIGEMEGNRP